jgi:hypothetical protein
MLQYPLDELLFLSQCRTHLGNNPTDAFGKLSVTFKHQEPFQFSPAFHHL